MWFYIVKYGSANKINHHEKPLNTLQVGCMNKTFPRKIAFFSCVGKLSAVCSEEALCLRKIVLPEPYHNHVRAYYKHLLDITCYLEQNCQKSSSLA